MVWRRLQRALAAFSSRGDEAETRLRAAIDALPEGVVFLDPQGRYIMWNERYADIYAKSADLFAVGAKLEDTLRVGVARGDYPDALGREEAWLAARLAKIASPSAPHEQRIADGRTILIEERKLADGSTIGLRVDVTDLKKKEESVRLLFKGNPLPMFLYDAATRVLLDANEAALGLYGYRADDLEGRDIGVLFDGPSPQGLADGAWRHRTAEGSLIEATLFSRELLLDGVSVVLMAAVDVTERKRAEQRLFHMARHDALTNLPNRVHFREKLEELLAAKTSFSLLLFDLDEFKGVNDTLGHSVGDLLLEQAARRIAAATRDQDLAARLGGDEFVVITVGAETDVGVGAVAERVMRALAQPFDLEGHTIAISASCGIARAPQDGVDGDVLLKHADLALYAAKAAGRRDYRFFESSMDIEVQARRKLEMDLKAAVLGGDLDVHYQPLVNLGDGSVTGYEALLRWRHPERGFISPAEFVPVAEDIGLIRQIGQMVLQRACADAATWAPHLRVAVNLSPSQFKSTDVLGSVVQALGASGLSPDRLELEITEALLMERDDKVLAALNGARALGVGLSLDDFGTGYASLSYLRLFPFTKIKIDQSFIRELRSSEDAQAIVRAILGLGESLGLKVLAEGIEHAEDAAYLKLMGCQEGQGYFFGKAAAMPASVPPEASSNDSVIFERHPAKLAKPNGEPATRGRDIFSSKA